MTIWQQLQLNMVWIAAVVYLVETGIVYKEPIGIVVDAFWKGFVN